MDIIYLRNLTVNTIIGIYPHERTTKQPVVINLEMAADIRKAAASDDISAALDYAAVAERLTQFIAERRDQLLETLANASAEMLLEEFKLPWLRLQIGKPQALANAEQAGIIIERGKLANP